MKPHSPEARARRYKQDVAANLLVSMGAILLSVYVLGLMMGGRA